MYHTTYFVVSIFALFVKFLCVDFEIDSFLRDKHSRTYLRKHKEIIVKDLLYIRYREEIPKRLFIENILFFTLIIYSFLSFLLSFFIHNIVLSNFNLWVTVSFGGYCFSRLFITALIHTNINRSLSTILQIIFVIIMIIIYVRYFIVVLLAPFVYGFSVFYP